MAVTRSIPAVYPGVANPVATQLVKGWAPTDISVTGTSDRLPLNKQTVLIKRVVPSTKRVNMVYSPGETDSVVVVTEPGKLLSAQGMTLVESTVPRTVDTAPATKNLIGKIGVIYTSIDNDVVSIYESLVKVANEVGIPLVVSDTDSVKCGAVAALGINYYKLGQQTGKVIAHILKGGKPGAITPAGSSDLELFMDEGATKE